MRLLQFFAGIFLVLSLFQAQALAVSLDPGTIKSLERVVIKAINSSRDAGQGKVGYDLKLSRVALELSETENNPNINVANKYGVYDMQFEILRIQVDNLDVLSRSDLYTAITRSNVVGIDIHPVDDLYYVTVVGAKRYSDISLDTTNAASGSILVSGQWIDKKTTPTTIYVREPGYTTKKYTITGASGNTFSMAVETPQAGKYTIEVNGKSESEGVVSCAIALFFRDVPPVYDYDVVESTDNSIERWFSLINRDRVRNNLPKLTLSQKLSAIALAHSRDMGDNNFVAHQSPATGDVQKRIGEIEYLRLGENVAVGNNVDTIHSGLMESPAHRENIMGDYTAVGLGLYKVGNKYYATQVFIKYANHKTQ